MKDSGQWWWVGKYKSLYKSISLLAIHLATMNLLANSMYMAQKIVLVVTDIVLITKCHPQRWIASYIHTRMSTITRHRSPSNRYQCMTLIMHLSVCHWVATNIVSWGGRPLKCYTWVGIYYLNINSELLISSLVQAILRKREGTTGLSSPTAC